MVIRKLSLYKCPSCGNTLEALPASPRSCHQCNSRMEEKRKGAVTKGSGKKKKTTKKKKG